MGGESYDLSSPRARAGRVGSSRCGGRSCPAGSYAALAVAAICASRPGRDQESRQSAADQAGPTHGGWFFLATTKLGELASSFRELADNSFSGILTLRGGREPTS